MEFIDIKQQYKKYKKSIDNRIKAVLDHGNFIMGPEVYELEEILADFVGVSHCISVASGTDSLEIALRALGVGYGDEVITVPFSWISSAEIISLVGATPVFVDIDHETFTINHDLIEKSITPKTKAIIAVSLYGQMPNIEKISIIAKKYNIPIIEDGAQSFGASRNGIRSCGATLIGSTSFFPAKPLGCFGDGGALFTNDSELSNIIKAIRTHGGIKRHHHTHIGMNGRMDTIQAAVLLGKWPWFREEIRTREEIGNYYSKHLSDYCITPVIDKFNTHVFGQYTIRVNANKREIISEELKKVGIPTGIYYPVCIHQQPVFTNLGYKNGSFPESETAAKEVLSIPMHPFMKKNEQDFIINTLINILKNK
jgi:UDP-2-acetamido-2-deoxy-ribo-hexuluronate aminotransferase